MQLHTEVSVTTGIWYNSKIQAQPCFHSLQLKGHVKIECAGRAIKHD